MRQVFSRDSASLSHLILSESLFCGLWMFCLEMVQWCECDLYCLHMLQFDSDGFCFKILVVCEHIWDLRYANNQESGEIQTLVGQCLQKSWEFWPWKSKKMCLYTLAFTTRWSIFCRIWSRRQWRVGNSPLPNNMSVHYSFVDRSFGAINLIEHSNQGQNYHICCLLTGASGQH